MDNMITELVRSVDIIQTLMIFQTSLLAGIFMTCLALVAFALWPLQK